MADLLLAVSKLRRSVLPSMATTCPSVTSCNAVIQLSRHFSNSAGLMRTKDRVEAVVRRDARAEVEKLLQKLLLRAAELGDGHKVVGAAEHRADSDRHNVDQRIEHRSSSWIGQIDEMVLDTDRGLLGHGSHPNLPRVASRKRSGSCRESPCPIYTTLPSMAQSPWDKEILHGIDINVEPGTITTLIGPSGSGKSMLLRNLAMLDPPTSGEVVVDELSVTFPRDTPVPTVQVWPRLTVVFQQLFLWPHITLRQNIHLPLRCRHATDADDRVESILEDFGISDLADRHANEVSLGQRQLAAIARASPWNQAIFCWMRSRRPSMSNMSL